MVGPGDVYVVVLGQFGHGKTTLVRALGRHGQQGEDQHLRIHQRGPFFPRLSTVVSFGTEKRHYTLFDIKGSVPGDLALLVVAADEGGTPETRQQVQLLRWLGIEQVVVFLSKVDLLRDDPDFIDLAEWEVRDLLSAHEYRGDEVPVIRGDARAALEAAGKDDSACACLHELAQALDACPAIPAVPEGDRPFLLAIEDVFSIQGRGTVATGQIERGRVRAGDEVEIVGLTPEPRHTVVVGVEMLSPLPEGVAGDNVGIILRDLGRSEVQRGQVLAAPGSVAAHTRFEAVLDLLLPEEGGRRSPIFTGYRPHFKFRTLDVRGQVTLSGVEQCLPGEQVRVMARVLAPVPLETGLRFALRDSSGVVGYGVATRILA
jgi:elongation factor Tu